MKRLISLFALFIFTAASAGCIISSLPESTSIKMSANGTQTFSISGIGDKEWYLDPPTDGTPPTPIAEAMDKSTYIYDPDETTVTTTEVHTVKASVLLNGMPSGMPAMPESKTWTVEVFPCGVFNGGVWDVDYTINTFEDIQALVSYSSVNGDLIITQSAGGNLENLDGLECLAEITGDLIIQDNPNLTNINGLRFIDTIGGNLTIKNNGRLMNLNGLSGLLSIGGELRISANSLLMNISGLSGIVSDSLISTATLTGLTILNNVALLSIDGLQGIAEVNGPVLVQDNIAIGNLDGLIPLRTITTGDLIIKNNFMLSKIDLYNLETIDGNLEITNNFIELGLAQEVRINFSSLTSVTGNISLLDNFLSPGGSEIPVSMNFPALTSIPGLFVEGNSYIKHLNGFSTLTSAPTLTINRNSALTTLGLDNLGSGSVTTLTIIENVQLPQCLAEQLRDQTSPTTATIQGNDAEGACDTDGDGAVDDADNCPDNPNPVQEDGDGDGVGDVCDNCPTTANPGQEDADSNGTGDVCETPAA